MRKFPFLLAVLALPVMPLAAAPGNEAVHVVEAGETLNGIANRAGVSPEALAKANGLKAPYVVKLGQKLTIPRAKATAAKDKPTKAPAKENDRAAPAKRAAAAANSTAKAAIAAAGSP